MPAIGFSLGLGFLRRLVGLAPTGWADAFTWNDNAIWSDDA